MRRATSFGVMALCAALTVACGSNRTAENNNTGANAPAPVDVQGCLTASGDRFVLTALQNAAPAGNAANGQNAPAASGQAAVPTTETYQLVSTGDNDLRKYVGQQVHVTGEADPAKVADVRELTPAAPATPQGSVGTAGNAANGANAPTVRTEEDTHFEFRKLRVSSVTAAGGACPAANQAGR